MIKQCTGYNLMAKYLVIGDPHARPDNLHKIKQLFQQVESQGLPTIWLGDLLDTKDIVRAQCLNAYINYFKNSSLQHIILVGNHDKLNVDTNEHSLEALKLLNNVTVVDAPLVVDQTLFVPYYRNPDEFRAVISQYKDVTYLFMHQDIKEMDYGNGYISTEGNTLEDLKQFKQVISGHYHSYQNKYNLIYLGTPFSHSFGESNQNKYLGIFDDSNGLLELITTDFPKHMTVNLDLNNPHFFETKPIDHVRLIIKGSREQLDKFDKKQYTKFKIIEECVCETHKSTLKETQSPETIYSIWYKEVENGTDEAILNLGLEVLKSVK